MTLPERRLWRALRGRQLDGSKFRSQHPLGPSIVDFICLDRCLVVEVDGGQHGQAAQIEHDAQRTQWLEREGYRVCRIWNNEVVTNLEGVLATIRLRLTDTPA